MPFKLIKPGSALSANPVNPGSTESSACGKNSKLSHHQENGSGVSVNYFIVDIMIFGGFLTASAPKS